MPALLDLGGGSSPRVKRTLPIVKNTAPNIGGNYSREAVARAVASRSAAPKPQPVVSRPQPSPAPKPPPVVVSNNQGNYTRPKPPPAVAPGPITGGGGGARGNNNTPKPVPKPVPAPISTKVTPTTSLVNPTPVVDAGPAPVAAPDIDQYLAGDATYQGQLNQFGLSLNDLQAQQLAARNQNAVSFAQRLRDLQNAQTQDEGNLQEDFASRGLAHSGSYADALSQLQNSYLTSQGNLQSEQTGAESDLVNALAAFQAQQSASTEDARMQALARRAAQYGL